MASVIILLFFYKQTIWKSNLFGLDITQRSLKTHIFVITATLDDFLFVRLNFIPFLWRKRIFYFTK